MSHRTLANCLKDAEQHTVNNETTNINIAAEPGYHSKFQDGGSPTATYAYGHAQTASPVLSMRRRSYHQNKTRE